MRVIRDRHNGMLKFKYIHRYIQSGPKVGIKYIVYNYCNTVYLLVAHSVHTYIHTYVGHLESKECLRIQPAQLFNFS